MKNLTPSLLRLYAYLPLPLTHLLGTLLGWGFYLLPNPHRRISAINLKLCFPELSRWHHHQLLRRSLIETGKTLCETPLLLFASPQRFQRLIHSVEQQPLADHALTERGILMATFHLGAWEVAGAYCSRYYPMVTLYRPPRQQVMDTILRQSRGRFGARLAALDSSGIRTSLQALKQGEMVGILPDQDPRESGNLFVPLFGVAANTMTLYGRLLQKGEATALFCTAERLSWGRGYRLHFHQPTTIDYHADLLTITTALNGELERQIRCWPTQYQWSYRRFRTRPNGEPDLYR